MWTVHQIIHRMSPLLVVVLVLSLGYTQAQDPSAQLAIRNALGRAQAVVSSGNAAAVAGFARTATGGAAGGAFGGLNGMGIIPPGRVMAPPSLRQHQRFNAEPPRVRAQRQPTILRLETARQLTMGSAADTAGFGGANTGAAGGVAPTVSYETLSTAPNWIQSWQAELGCPERPRIPCDPFSLFRTADGSCNNLNNPEWGMSFTPQERYLQAEYDDNIDAPRVRSVIPGELLPSARSVSRNVLRNPGPTTLNNRNTMMIMAWGQFLDHDITSTPAQKEPNGEPIICCGQPPRPECFNIEIVLPDPHFTTDCMNFVRSSPALADPCLPSQRQQINQLTSYHDASNVYGSTLQQSNTLRAVGVGGVLLANLATRPGNLPPEDPDPNACLPDPDHADHYCPLGGDHRISEVVFLGANHVTWLRMHNRIVDELRSFGNGWSEERLFQETRKIIAALQQHITYDEYLPTMLNFNYRSAFCLTPFCQIYSPQINGAIKNSFSTAVLRMGHSQIPSNIGYVSPNHNSIVHFPLRNHFNKPTLYIQDGGTRVDDMQRYVTSQGAAATDRQLELEIADHLFTDGVLSFDLGALNIQRGRDHGLPPYVRFREYCGLPRVFFFAPGPGGLSSHTPDAVARLRSVYRHQNDIDLYAGALSETPVPGGELGPTFACLFALQMRDLKVGDRFFWSRPDPVTGFTPAQRNAIRRTRLSTVLCQALNMNVVQRNVFYYVQPGNGLIPCFAIPRLNLNPWRAGFGGGRRGGAGATAGGPGPISGGQGPIPGGVGPMSGGLGSIPGGSGPMTGGPGSIPGSPGLMMGGFSPGAGSIFGGPNGIGPMGVSGLRGFSVARKRKAYKK